MIECPRCDGAGEIGRRGESVNPWNGMLVPDPQCDATGPCPQCHGEGAVLRCPDCWKGKPLPCAVGCREWEGCCDKRLDVPCERCDGTGWLVIARAS